MRRSTCYVAGCLLIAGTWLKTSTAEAYRPFDGTDGDVAEYGEFELELGPAELVHEEGRNYPSTATVLNLGILPRIEAVLDFVGVYPLERETGEASYQVRDTDFFFKFLLRKGALQDEGGPSIAVETGPLTPEINGEGGLGYSTNLILSERYDWFIVHLNNEGEFSRRDLDFAWANALITEFHFSDTAWPVAELGFERDFAAKENRYSALVGAIWSVADGLDLDAAGVLASDAGEAAYEVRFGLTWAFQVWGGEEEAGEGEGDELAKGTNP